MADPLFVSAMLEGAANNVTLLFSWPVAFNYIERHCELMGKLYLSRLDKLTDENVASVVFLILQVVIG